MVSGAAPDSQAAFGVLLLVVPALMAAGDIIEIEPLLSKGAPAPEELSRELLITIENPLLLRCRSHRPFPLQART